jgi:polyphosphate kinase
MQFNRRVLEEALDPHNPVLERAKFLAITASNLDEFVEVRVAGLLQQAEQGKGETGPDGLAPGEVLTELGAAMHEFVKDQTIAGAKSCFPRCPKSRFACEASAR